MVASLLLVASMEKAHSCTIAANVAAGTAAIGVGEADPRVGYTPDNTLEEQR
jgi:hypothetical protein